MIRVYVFSDGINISHLAQFFKNPYLNGSISMDFTNEKQAQKFANQMRSQGNSVIICMV